MKKFLLMLLVVLSIIVGVGCKENIPEEKNEPIFPNEATDTVYATVKFKDITYNITKEDMFVHLRADTGLGVVVEWTNELMVKTIGKEGLIEVLTNGNYKDIEEVSYYDLVTEEEIDKAIENDKYPNGKDNYTSEEIQELEQDFANQFYKYGYRTTEDIRKYYRIELAEEKIAKDYQELYRSGVDFGNGDYQSYWKNNMFDNYYMIIVPFETELSFKNTLKELNIKVDDSDENNKKFVKNDTGEALTDNEIIDFYIKLYNNSNIFKESVDKSYQLTEGKEYSIENGNYKFNLDKESVLYYPSSVIKTMNSRLRTALSTLSSYNSESTENSNWYTTLTEEISSTFYTILLVGKEEKKSYEDSKEEIRQILLDNEFITGEDEITYTETVMNQLRLKFELVIYDKFIQDKYINEYYPGDSFYDGNVKYDGVILSFMDELLTTDELFDLMDYRFGPFALSELINYYNELYDKDINQVYDLTVVGSEKDRIINNSAWQNVLLEVESEKEMFESGGYGVLGYLPSYGWENFLMEIYQVRTDKELAYYYLWENLKTDYLEDKYSLSNYDEASLYWQKFKDVMQELADEYISATGFEFALSYLDENGNYADPSTWSSEQKALIEEFYGLLVEYFIQGKNAYKDFAELIDLKYDEAPYLIGDNTSGELFYNMDLAKYKTAGIALVYDNLGTFGADDVNSALLEAAKELWVKDPTSEEVEVYGKNDGGYKYIVSDVAYHVYVKVSNNDMDRFEERNIPTLEEIKLYLKDSDTEDLTDEQKGMIEDYYTPVFNSLAWGSYNYARLCYKKQGNCEVNVKSNNYVYDEYQKYLSIVIIEMTDLTDYVID